MLQEHRATVMGIAPDAEVVQASDLLKEAAAGIVHDLGNLIQIAASAISILSRNARIRNDESLQPILCRARVSLERAGALVHQTMGRTSAPETRVMPVRENVDVAQALAEIGDLIAGLCEPDIALTLRADAGLPDVDCSRLDLQNAVLNLVINARDAMPSGGAISVLACLDQDAMEGPVVDLKVMDDGRGMDRDTLMRAFTPRFTTKGPGRGSGLGLAMVKRFVDDATAKVGIASAPGVGTTVSIRLPAAATGPEWPTAA